VNRQLQSRRLTLLQSILKPDLVKNGLAFNLDDLALKRMLKSDLSAILLAKEATHNRPLLVTESMPSDVVADGEQDQRMESYLETRVGGFLRGEQRVPKYILDRHDEMDWSREGYRGLKQLQRAWWVECLFVTKM
jgi:hypothetical protein